MRSDERRRELTALLLSTEHPIPGAELASALGVSRQIIVSDIARLKTEGVDVLSTHTGYILRSSPYKERVFKVRHTRAQTVDELSTIIGLGGIVADVFVWHKVYGRISAPLNIFSPRGIEQFAEGIKSGKSTELMHITSGYHYHTVRADSSELLDAIEKALSEKGYIVPEIE